MEEVERAVELSHGPADGPVEMETVHHLQLYCEFTRAVRMSRIKSLFDQRVHCEAAGGTQAQNIEYCTKDRSRCGCEMAWSIESGTRARSRPRGTTVLERARSGERPMEIIASMTERDQLRYAASVSRICSMAMVPRDSPPEIIIYYGKPGTGKSYQASLFDDAYRVTYTKRGWMDGFVGQKVVLFEEFRSDMPYGKMLKICDRYALQLEVKGGFVQFNAEKLVFTTNYKPGDWYPGIRDKSALRRRLEEFGKIYEFTRDCTEDSPIPMPVIEERDWDWAFRQTTNFVQGGLQWG